MAVNIADVRLRRDQALKTMSVVLVRKLLLDDFEALLKEIEKVRHGNNGASKADYMRPVVPKPVFKTFEQPQKGVEIIMPGTIQASRDRFNRIAKKVGVAV